MHCLTLLDNEKITNSFMLFGVIAFLTLYFFHLVAYGLYFLFLNFFEINMPVKLSLLFIVNVLFLFEMTIVMKLLLYYLWEISCHYYQHYNLFLESKLTKSYLVLYLCVRYVSVKLQYLTVSSKGTKSFLFIGNWHCPNYKDIQIISFSEDIPTWTTVYKK